MSEIPEEGSALDQRIRGADCVQMLLCVRDWLVAHGPAKLVEGLTLAGGDLCLALCILDAMRRGLLRCPELTRLAAKMLADIDKLLPRTPEDVPRDVATRENPAASEGESSRPK